MESISRLRCQACRLGLASSIKPNSHDEDGYEIVEAVRHDRGDQVVVGHGEPAEVGADEGALPIAAPAAKLALNETDYDAIENQLEFGKACAESFLEGSEKVGDWLTSDDEAQLHANRSQLAHGVELRELHAILRSEDPANRFGGLVRVQNKRREFLWVHRQFVDKY